MSCLHEVWYIYCFIHNFISAEPTAEIIASGIVMSKVWGLLPLLSLDFRYKKNQIPCRSLRSEVSISLATQLNCKKGVSRNNHSIVVNYFSPLISSITTSFSSTTVSTFSFFSSSLLFFLLYIFFLVVNKQYY